MALKINKSEETYEYIPLSERGDEAPFTVKLKRILPRQFTILEDKMAKINKDESISFTTGSFNWEVLKKGVTGWVNMIDEDGKDIKCLKSGAGEVLDNSLNYLPLTIITEIANVLTGISKDPDNAEVYLGTVDETDSAK